MRIIPAIDIIDGKCVRLSKGDYSTKKVYYENPLEVAKEFEANGIKFLHLVDLDGAKSKSIVNQNVLYEIATKTSLKVDFGGGIKSTKDVRIAFESGASQVTGGSVAAQNPDLFLEWVNEFGPEKIILGADSKSGFIATNGWKEYTNLHVIDFIQKMNANGINFCICTDIEKDGMLNGPSIGLYKEILKSSNVNLIASGGVSSFQDLIALKQIGCEGAILGKALYENKVSLKQLALLC